MSTSLSLPALQKWPMLACERCGVPIEYSHWGGRATAIDEDGHTHICPAPEPGHIHECICGAQVVDEANHRYDWPDRTVHVHRQTARRRRAHSVRPPEEPPAPTEPLEETNETPSLRGIEL